MQRKAFMGALNLTGKCFSETTSITYLKVKPSLGQCQLCTNRMISDGLTKNQLFLKHIASIIDSVKKRHPTIEILIWDDHFRTLQEENFKSNSIFKSFKPVIWWYGKNVYDELGPSLWSMYSNVFSSVWLASAYKGTTRTKITETILSSSMYLFEF